jgi:glycosyltransferase involved in cell wall biosynthesis
MGLSGKRVLLTTAHRNIRSGGGVQFYLLARSLVEAGARVEAVFNQPRRSASTADNLHLLAELDVPVRLLRVNRWYSPVQVTRLRAWLRDGRYDIVHTHKGADLKLVLFAAWGLPLPCLVNTRGVNFPLGVNRLQYRAKRLDRIIVVSENSRRVMIDRGVPAEKIRVIYGGVDTRRFRPRPDDRLAVRQELGLPAEARVCVVAANLVRQKGHGDYLKAAAALRDSHVDLWHVFAGGGDQTALRARATELGVADRVIFTGFRGDMERIYAAADLSAMPSFAGEGVSGVLREAMACGVPVVTADVGGNAELVTDGETGLVVPTRRPDALAAALARLLDEPELHPRLAAAGQQLVLTRYSAEARAQKIFALYEEVFREKRLPF